MVHHSCPAVPAVSGASEMCILCISGDCYGLAAHADNIVAARTKADAGQWEVDLHSLAQSLFFSHTKPCRPWCTGVPHCRGVMLASVWRVDCHVLVCWCCLWCRKFATTYFSQFQKAPRGRGMMRLDPQDSGGQPG